MPCRDIIRVIALRYPDCLNSHLHLLHSVCYFIRGANVSYMIWSADTGLSAYVTIQLDTTRACITKMIKKNNNKEGKKQIWIYLTSENVVLLFQVISRITFFFFAACTNTSSRFAFVHCDFQFHSVRRGLRVEPGCNEVCV